MFDGVEANPRVFWCARAGGEDEGLGREAFDVFKGDGIIADDVAIYARQREVSGEVVGERIVVVD